MASATHCRLSAHFALLKQRLLLKELDALPLVETHALVIQQAGEAAALAWLSGYPLLTFPCLFEEMADEATAVRGRQARLYWSGFALPPALPRREHPEASPTRYLMRLWQERQVRRSSRRATAAGALEIAV